MIFLSILAKTFALALVAVYPWLALVLWVAGAAADLVEIRRKVPAGEPQVLLVRLALLQGASLLIGWVALAGCDYAAMRWKDGVPVFAGMVSWLLGCCGVVAGSRDGLVFLTTMAGPQEFAASIDGMALKVPALFLVLGMVRMLWAETPVLEALRRLGVITAILLAVAVVRMTGVVLLANLLFDFVGYETEELPWRPFMDSPAMMLYYLPFLLAVGVWLGRVLNAPKAPPDAAVTAMPGWLRWGAVPATLVLALMICWQPAGTPKKGKVVIAGWHSQWSQCARPYDRDWYGADSGYNYACMKRLFEFFHPVALAEGPLTAKDLDGASTLVIYDPDRRFNEDEIKLVREFVSDGGGLLVVGDHTNVFGSTTHLNELCEPFGFQFRDDVLFDLDEDFHQLIEAPPLAPAAWHGIGFFKLRGPTSIRPTSLWTRPVYEVGHSKSVRAIYSVNNFYPPPYDDPKMKTGDFCVASTSHYGRGRVAAWADSTVFSNFEIFYPGKCEYLLNTIHWLGHEDSMLPAMARRMGLLVLIGGLGAILLGYRRPQVWLGAAVLVSGAWLAATWVSRAAEHRRAEFPQPIRANEWVVFSADSHDKAHHLRGFQGEGPYDQRYEVFVQWVLRTGAMTGFHLLDVPEGNALHEHLRGCADSRVARALIVRKPEDLEQLDALAAVPADNGDPVLLMFAGSIPVEDAVAAVKHSGLLGSDSAAAEIASAWPAGEVLVEDGGRRVLVVAGAERFSDQAMGISEKVTPDAGQRELFGQAYGVIDRLMGRETPATK
ncbi:MAG: hypothetical protein K9N23_02435 [Akkermansiaceae bacterium]|nr:hypothetical protein [Akkermansiaceae bacterium]